HTIDGRLLGGDSNPSAQSSATASGSLANDHFAPFSTEMGCPPDVRLSPNSGAKADIAGCLKRANKRLMHRSKFGKFRPVMPLDRAARRSPGVTTQNRSAWSAIQRLPGYCVPLGVLVAIGGYS